MVHFDLKRLKLLGKGAETDVQVNIQWISKNITVILLKVIGQLLLMRFPC